MSKKLSETKLKLSKEFLNISRQKIKALPIEKLLLLVRSIQSLLAFFTQARIETNKRYSQTLLNVSSASLSGPDFLKLSRQQIKALSLDELQLLVLRSQRLLATALFKPVQCLFEVMPDEFVIEIFLEWLPIEELAVFDLALTNHHYRNKFLYLLRHTVHRGVLSVSRNKRGYKFDSGVAAWLESRNVFMRAVKFCDRKRDIPAGFLARTGKQLLKIDLTGCRKVSDAGLLEFVRRCPRLEDVSLGGCEDILDTAVASLAKHCPGLHTVDLDNTRVSDTGLASLGEGCRALKSIRLSSIMSDTGLRKLAKGCPRLEDVSLERCRDITDGGVASLTHHCTGLHTLILWGTEVTDTGLASLGAVCRALKKIDLHGLAISDTGLRKLAEGCPRLEDVHLMGCRNITDGGVASLAQHCAKLCSLHLRGTQVTDTGLGSLGKGCVDMKNIDFFQMMAVSDTGLRKLAEGCPRLEDVNLRGCGNISDVGVASLAQHCAGLHTLILSGTQVTDSGLARLGEGCRALKNIDLFRLRISDTGLRKLAEGCSRLEDVNLMGCRHITDGGVASLAQHCSVLHTLSLGCTQVTDTGLARLGKGCRALKIIKLVRLTISDTGLGKLAEGCPRLEHVSLMYCVAITDNGVASLVQHCAWLCELELRGTQVTNDCNASLQSTYPGLKVYS